jgi:hypothetical protein
MNQSPVPFDPNAYVERIVQEVIRRLLAMQAQGGMASGGMNRGGVARGGNPFAAGQGSGATPVTVSEKLITVATLDRLPAGTTEVTLAARAVVTPLARDEARDRGIRLNRNPSTIPQKIPKTTGVAR